MTFLIQVDLIIAMNEARYGHTKVFAQPQGIHLCKIAPASKAQAPSWKSRRNDAKSRNIRKSVRQSLLEMAA